MASYTLKNDLSTVPLNCNTGYNNSWINVENNADRQIFAQASYITNFDDINIIDKLKDRITIQSYPIKVKIIITSEFSTPLAFNIITSCVK